VLGRDEGGVEGEHVGIHRHKVIGEVGVDDAPVEVAHMRAP
jgi:hypothetical protein